MSFRSLLRLLLKVWTATSEDLFAEQEYLKYYKQYDLPKGIGIPSPEEVESMPGITRFG